VLRRVQIGCVDVLARQARVHPHRTGFGSDSGQRATEMAAQPASSDAGNQSAVVFAVGDIRSGNVKRVASAVGEGSIPIHLVHLALVER
jgi:thioredoxin reductase